VLNRNLIYLFAVLVSSCSSGNEELPYFPTPDFEPHFITADEADEKQIHEIGTYSFIDQDGTQFDRTSLNGKIHVAGFFFTGCASICPTMTANLMKVHDTFMETPEVELVSFTVTPWIDSVERLHDYATAHEIRSEKWHFLTGSTSDIYRVARRDYFAEEDLGFTKDSTDFLHTEHLILVDETGRIRGIYNGTLKLEINQLIEDIEQLLPKAKLD